MTKGLEGRWQRLRDPATVISAVAGVLAVVLAAYFGFRGSPSRSQANSPPGHPSKTSSPSTTPSTASAPGIAFAGAVGITFSGIDFDNPTPGQGPNYINWQRYNDRLEAYGSGSAIVSRYPSSGLVPTEAECRTWAQTHNSQILDGVNVGDRLCFITQAGRTVRFIVTGITGITNDTLEGQATVWNDGN